MLFERGLASCGRSGAGRVAGRLARHQSRYHGWHFRGGTSAERPRHCHRAQCRRERRNYAEPAHQSQSGNQISDCRSATATLNSRLSAGNWQRVTITCPALCLNQSGRGVEYRLPVATTPDSRPFRPSVHSSPQSMRVPWPITPCDPRADYCRFARRYAPPRFRRGG